ncbi:PEP-CTERM sorting domain-containing protein [Pseudoduganella lutea]|uniref:PEP-CTERM sorting domain-containing protein n=1 Tax=Pseudoduganella lutea TaxID=321985 RepID=UPI001A9267FB|nr:PEP-CTERM sorting domain-containing protein [Pseudoduganella lutea]
MRSIFTPLLAVPAILLHSVALAETSVSVPAFALDISSYESYSQLPVSVEVPTASISILSTSQTSTVISLDSFEGALDVRAGGSHMLAYVWATMTLQAALGYQITGIEFSASTYAIRKPPTLPSNAIIDGYGGFATYAWSSAAISDVGASEPLTEQYFVSNFTTPIPVGWNLSNPAGLSNFDLTMEVWSSARSFATYYVMPDEEFGTWHKAYGTTEVYYVDPLLTVYTAALPVPEPGIWTMMGAGLLLIGATRRRYVAQAKGLSHQPGK